MKDKFYYKDGTTSERLDLNKVLHRTDGPAMEFTSGSKSWFIDGKRHRIDGPASEFSNGSKYWFIDDKQYSEEEFKALIKEVESLSETLRLIDPREWVRKM